jgi:hypothetical protein
VPLACPLPAREPLRRTTSSRLRERAGAQRPGEGTARSTNEAVAKLVRGLAHRNLLDCAPPVRGVWNAA